ncbi:MAG: thermosome subunit alpha [Halobacteriota archaeon]|nr:thermosome subunit alpha [Halobacteriota archaeon]
MLSDDDVSGDEIRETNLLVSLVLSDMFKSVLGPKGLNKLIVKEEDFDLVSSNGLYILTELDYDEHPTANMIMNAGKTQSDETGDGVTTVLVLIGELLKRGFELNEMGVSFPIVSKAYSLALEKSMVILDELAITEEMSDEFLFNIARTSLKHHRDLAGILVECVKRISDELPIDTDDVTIVAESGKGIVHTKFIEGVVVDRSGLRSDLPKKIEDGKIALINLPVERKKPRADAKLKISNPSYLRGFKDEESAEFRSIINTIRDCGANIVCCQKAVDDEAVDILGRDDVIILKRVKNTDLKRLSKSTGAEIIDEISELDSGKLGSCDMIVEKKLSSNKYIFFVGCPYHKSSAIVIRGSDMHVLEGIVSEAKNAMRCIATAIEDQRVLPGGGATEIELAKRLRKYGNTIGGKEQLAIHAFADALEVIPRTIAKNLGMDPIDAIIELNTSHENDANIGISGDNRKPGDMISEGIIEPFNVKKHAIISSTSAAIALLRVDDLVVAKQEAKTGLRQEYESPEFKYRRGRIKY